MVLPLEIQEASNPGLRAESRKIALFVAWRPSIKETPTTSLITNAHFDNILGEVQMPAWYVCLCSLSRMLPLFTLFTFAHTYTGARTRVWWTLSLQ